MGQNLKLHVEGESIGEAYLKALNYIRKNNNKYQYLTVHISKPIINTSMKKTPQSLNIDDWYEIINVGSIYEDFCSRSFGNRSGKDWINDRIEALLNPNRTYGQRLQIQLNMVEKRLRARDKNGKKMHGACTNSLICTVFRLEDLERACLPRPNARGLPCLVMLDFKPKKDKLSLLSIFRSQFFHGVQLPYRI